MGLSPMIMGTIRGVTASTAFSGYNTASCTARIPQEAQHEYYASSFILIDFKDSNMSPPWKLVASNTWHINSQPAPASLGPQPHGGFTERQAARRRRHEWVVCGPTCVTIGSRPRTNRWRLRLYKISKAPGAVHIPCGVSTVLEILGVLFCNLDCRRRYRAALFR